jgi:transposase
VGAQEPFIPQDKRRLKKQEHGLKVRIRNQLLATYFPEFDRYYRQSDSQGLAIVRWCLDPSVIAGLKYDEFVRLVAPRTRTIGQRDRLKAIWKKASGSIGCDAGENLEFEAKVMVEGLKHVQKAISEVNDKIEDIIEVEKDYRSGLSAMRTSANFS